MKLLSQASATSLLFCIAASRQTGRELLVKNSKFPCLYRHQVNDDYYGAKKVSGKRKEQGLTTTERKIAKTKLIDQISTWAKLKHGAKSANPVVRQNDLYLQPSRF